MESAETGLDNLIIDPQIKAARKAVEEGNLGKNHSFKERIRAQVPYAEIPLVAVRTKSRLQCPVRLATCQHQDCFDLNELLHKVFIEKQPRRCLVSSCGKTFTDFKTEIVIDRTFENILSKVRKDCSQVSYYFETDFFYCNDPIKINSDKQAKFDRIIQGISIRKDYDLKDVLKFHRAKEFIPIVLICPISLRRVNLPCRFKSCQHVEVFDLVPFLNSLTDSQPSQCPICKYTPQNNEYQKELRLDRTLFEFLRFHPYTIFKGLITTARQSIEPFPEKSNYLQEKLVNLKMNDVRVGSLKKYEEAFASILQSYREAEKLESALDENKRLIDQTRETVEINLGDAVSKELMILPVRFKNCKHIEAIDARTFAVLYGEAFINNTPMIKCPVGNCDSIIDEDDFDEYYDYVYVDGFLVRALMLDRMTVRYIPSRDEFYDPNDVSRIKEIIKSRRIENPLGPHKKKTTIFLTCELTKERMRVPVVSSKCNHNACMDLEAYLNFQPEKCPMEDCDNELFSEDMGIDAMVEKIIKLNPLRDSVKYNITKGQIDEEFKAEEDVISNV